VTVESPSALSYDCARLRDDPAYRFDELNRFDDRRTTTVQIPWWAVIPGCLTCHGVGWRPVSRERESRHIGARVQWPRSAQHPYSSPRAGVVNGHGERNTTHRDPAMATSSSRSLACAPRFKIADTAGILPGSLYHHFESKEAILVELVRGEARRAGPARSLIHLRDNVLRGMVARGA